MRERRSAPRRTPAAEETFTRVRLRAGGELVVVDLSDAGALVEGPTRLLPGTHVEVHVVTREGRTLVRSRVTRAVVFAVAADALLYRAALAFDRRVDTEPGRVATTHPRQSSADAGSAYPNQTARTRSAEEGAC